MAAPCAEVPLPLGRPVPSGRMWISHAARSAWFKAVPRFGPAANAGAASKTKRRLGIDMAHASVRIDGPARDAVVVLAWEAERRRYARRLAALRDDLGARRLHVALVVPSAALQYRRAAIPLPRHAKARERLAHHRLLQRGLRPALAAVGRHHDLGDLAGAGIGDA